MLLRRMLAPIEEVWLQRARIDLGHTDNAIAPQGGEWRCRSMVGGEGGGSPGGVSLARGGLWGGKVGGGFPLVLPKSPPITKFFLFFYIFFCLYGMWKKIVCWG